MERHIDGKRPVAAKGRVGESDMCKVFPTLSGIHSSSAADRVIVDEQYQGALPADTDRADLGLPTGTFYVRGDLV